MKRKMYAASLLFVACSLSLLSCGGGGNKNASTPTDNSTTASNELKFDDVQLSTPLDAKMVEEGKNIYQLKCQACHKLTNEKLVGPGWKGVTQRRKPGWIISMATNPDLMLEKDPDAGKLLEQLLVRMPNQNLSKDDARKILEFMRSNDGEK